MKNQPVQNEKQDRRREQLEFVATVTIAAIIGIFFFVVAVYTINKFY